MNALGSTIGVRVEEPAAGAGAAGSMIPRVPLPAAGAAGVDGVSITRDPLPDSTGNEFEPLP